MAALGTVLGVIGTISSLAGTIMGASAQRKAGEASNSVAQYEASQLDLRANEERAASQREALELGRQQDLLTSRQQALVAADGGDTLDVTAQDLASDVVREGSYRRGLVQYAGLERARGVRAQATATRLSGQAALAGAKRAAAATLIGGFGSTVSSFYDMFGGGRPLTGTDPYLRYG